uniref:Uncharacterized protein n=1 Tax=Anguilla anguilla TaxID=7936 RepID=A0A0E9UTZ3_ANGAN
MNLARHEQNR